MTVHRYSTWAACLALACAVPSARAQFSIPTPKINLPKPPKIEAPKLPNIKPPKLPDIKPPDLSKLDPVAAAKRELENARRSAMKTLHKLDPDRIFGEVRRSLDAFKAAAQAKTGLKVDERTGDVDLRGHSSGKTLQRWMEKFAQGNEGKGEVEEFRYNFKSRQLVLRVKARHRQRQNWGVLGKVDLYDCTQKARLQFDFARGDADFAIDLGPLGPKITSKSFKALKDGDLLAAAEAAAPSVLGKLAGVERKNDYDKVCQELRRKHGRYVYVSSKEFVDAAGSQKIGKYAATALGSGGTAVWPQIMRDLQEMASKELPKLAAWLEGHGQSEARRMAEKLLTGRRPDWPYLKFEMIAVPYYAREANISKAWRRFNNLGFIVVIEPRYVRK